MEELNLPSSFPTRERLTNRIQDTVAYSWAIKDFNDANINEWLNNFKGEVFPEETEKRIALWLLANYTYYSEKEIEHLCKTLYKKFIHNLAVKESLDKNGLLEKMKELCYIPLGNASESGGFIAYEFRKQAKIGIDRFYYPNEVNKFNGNTAIFIDDVTLSATQAKGPIVSFMNENKMESVYLLTIVGSKTAIKELNEVGINAICCIEVDERDKCFSDNSLLFYKFKDLKEPVRKMCDHYGQIVYSMYPLGYKDGQYLFGFYYNTPNNTLPIFWSSYNGWKPMFERKGKFLNDARIWKTFEKFI